MSQRVSFSSCLVLATVVTARLIAQGIITTVAGTDFSFPNQPQIATSAPLGSPRGLALDASGNVFLADLQHSLILKVDRKGILSVVAGNGVYGFSGDGGLATSASLRGPCAVAIDSQGNLFIADTYNDRVRKVTPNGIITTVAGNAKYGFAGDGGSATAASLSQPEGITVDLTGNLYIADTDNHRIRRVTPTGVITTIAGNAASPYVADTVNLDDGGPATKASLNQPAGIYIDSAGNLFIADRGHNRIRKVNSSGIITTVAGNGIPGSSGDGGAATRASLNPEDVFVDRQGNLLITATDRIRKVTPGGVISTFAGNGTLGFSGDGGVATNASLNYPHGIGANVSGDVFFADADNNRVRQVTPDGLIKTVAGSGTCCYSGDGVPATSASLYLSQDSSAAGIAEDSAGNLFIADPGNNRIRRVAPDGKITTVAGNGNCCFSGDGGPATAATLNYPNAVSVGVNGDLFIADTFNRRIRRVTTSGTISTVAGNGTTGSSGDGGLATNASLSGPAALAIDRLGNLFIADGLEIRKVNSNGIITTIAGNGTIPFLGSIGDGGLATAAPLYLPKGVAVDGLGNVFIADTSNNRIRQVKLNGVISTLAGNGKGEFSGDGGPATAASLRYPYGVSLDGVGHLYVADTGNHRIRMVDLSSGVITTVAGNGTATLAGDGGSALKASLAYPNGLVVDSLGGLLIADGDNARIRKVLTVAPKLYALPGQMQFVGVSGGRPSPSQTIAISGDISGLGFLVQSNTPWLRISPQSGATPALIEVSADATNLKPGSYAGTITIMVPDALPSSSTIAISFAVSASETPKLESDKQSLSFAFPKDGKLRSQLINLSNSGSGTLAFSALPKVSSGGNWLSVSPGSGQISASLPTVLIVTANPSGLPPGTYTGSVTITTSAGTQVVSTAMTISAIGQAILLSQSGLSYLGVSRGGIVPPQAFGVINIGSGVVNWTVTKSTLSGGPDWLQLGTTSGATDAGSDTVPKVSVSVNSSVLAPGKYYGLIQVDAPGAANSPQVITVFLQLLQPDSDIGAVVQPAEMLFTPSSGGAAPGSQDLMIYNVASTAKSFRSLVSADAALRIVARPADGTLDPQEPTRIVIQPFTDGLPPGLYRGTVTLQFSDGRVRELRFSVVVGTAASTSGAAREAGSVCTPSSLLQALTTLGQSFNITAGYPVALGVDVRDDCGTPLESGSVTASFSNGDPSVTLQSIKGGHWEGTWTTKTSSSAQVVMKLQASDAAGKLRGERQIRGLAEAQADPPNFDKSGVFSAASAERFVPVAPGSIISIYGERLAPDAQAFSTTPLPQEMQNTNVVMAGRLLPLYFVSPNQINAQVPFDLNINTPYQIYVRKGITASQPILVDVAPTQPAIFAIVGVPAKSGDVIVMYASGLGLVTPAVVAGAVAGSTLSYAANQVQASIGGKDASIAFAGLAPGFVGLYQINATIPSGIAAGPSIPVILSVAGQTSPTFLIPIQ